MKNFFDKLKDILYDGTEYILMIAIIGTVALIINWRLDGLFAMDIGGADNNLETNTESIVEEYSEYVEDKEEEIEEEEAEDSESKEEIIDIVIPSGTLPNEIGDILVSYELVDSRSEFLNKVIEMGVETKLKSGTFKIAKDSSLEEIVNILTK